MNQSKLQLQQFSSTLFSLLVLVSKTPKKYSQPEISYQNKKSLTGYKQSQNQQQKERRATESKPTFHELMVQQPIDKSRQIPINSKLHKQMNVQF